MPVSMSAQRHEWRITLGVDYCSKNLENALETLSSEYGYTYYAIKHYVQEDTEYVHYHLVISSAKILRAKQVINHLCDCFGCDSENVQLLYCPCVASAVQYLIHKNNPDKHQYMKEEVFTNDPRQYDCLLKEPLGRLELTTKTLLEIMHDCNYDRMAILEKIGINYYTTYRSTINDIIKHYTGEL